MRRWSRCGSFSPRSPRSSVPATPPSRICLKHLPEGALLLFDLGFYAFRWFDTLTLAGIYFVSRQRRKVSCQVLHVLYDGPAGPVHLRDRLVSLGAYRADRAG